MFVFRKIWRALFSCNTRFEIHLFAFLPTNSRLLNSTSVFFSPLVTVCQLIFA